MALDERIRDRVRLTGGKVAGVSCPECAFETRDVDLEAHSLTDTSCPECGAVIVSEAKKTELREAGKL